MIRRDSSESDPKVAELAGEPRQKPWPAPIWSQNVRPPSADRAKYVCHVRTWLALRFRASHRAQTRRRIDARPGRVYTVDADGGRIRLPRRSKAHARIWTASEWRMRCSRMKGITLFSIPASVGIAIRRIIVLYFYCPILLPVSRTCKRSSPPDPSTFFSGQTFLFRCKHVVSETNFKISHIPSKKFCLCCNP